MNRLPVEIRLLRLFKGDHRRPEFLLMNPLGKVPVLEDGSLVLPESSAILMYLAAKYQVADHWYPACPRQRALVEAAMHWHQGNTRTGTKGLVFRRVLARRMYPDRPPSAEMVADSEATLRVALRGLEDYWLAQGPYVANAQDVSVADLLIACELEQLQMLSGDPSGPQEADFMEGLPRVAAWRERVRRRCGAPYEDVHSVLRARSKM